MTIAEIIAAIFGSNVLTGIIAAWLSRHKTNGTAAESYARASQMVAEQNTALTLQVNKLTMDITALRCANELLAAKNEAAIIEARTSHDLIENLRREIAELRLALREKLDDGK